MRLLSHQKQEQTLLIVDRDDRSLNTDKNYNVKTCNILKLTNALRFFDLLDFQNHNCSSVMLRVGNRCINIKGLKIYFEIIKI